MWRVKALFDDFPVVSVQNNQESRVCPKQPNKYAFKECVYKHECKECVLCGYNS